MSSTDGETGFYSGFCPDIFIHNEFKSDVLARIIRHQKKQHQRGDRAGCFMVLDDCLHHGAVMTKDQNLRNIILNGRHINVFLCMSTQYVYGLPPEIRGNVDWLFVCKENNVQNQYKLWQSFFGMFPTFDSFKETLAQCTENFEVLVLDNS